MTHRAAPIYLFVLLSAAVVGCADDQEMPADDSALAGGTTPSMNPAFSAIGAIRLERDDLPGSVLEPCAATLVAPDLVATARHCVEALASSPYASLSFYVSPWSGSLAASWSNSGSYYAAAIYLEGDAVDDEGNPIGFTSVGNELALVRLRDPIPASIAKPIPFRKRPVDASDEGRSFVSVSFRSDEIPGAGNRYSMNVSTRDFTTRASGPVHLVAAGGQPLHRAFPTKAAFAEFIEPYLDEIQKDSGATVAEIDAARANLLDDYDRHLSRDEAYVGLGAGDVRLCRGDSGAPVLEKMADGSFELVGVTTGGPEGPRMSCFLGGAIATLGSGTAEAAKASSSWDACELNPAAPTFTSPWACDGDTRVACTGTKESDINLKDDCAARGKRCEAVGSGPAACVDP